MSDKPEKIWLIQMDDYNLVWCDSPDPTNGETIPDEDRTEYLRADLAKPSEWISVELKRLLLAVNAVTGQHRHHNLPTKKALDNLANRQLEYEESLNQLPSPPTRETP